MRGKRAPEEGTQRHGEIRGKTSKCKGPEAEKGLAEAF